MSFQPIISRIRKEDVFVPEYPDKKAFEGYHGIPANEYLQKCKDELERHFSKNLDSSHYTIETHPRENGISSLDIQKLDVSIIDKKIKIVVYEAFKDRNHQYTLEPTKFGFDTVDSGKYPRFWIYNEITHEDFNLITKNHSGKGKGKGKEKEPKL